MDVIFNCPKCDQELAVDSSGAGTEINCPSCGEAIVIPEPESVASRPGIDSDALIFRVGTAPVNRIVCSVCVNVEMLLCVTVHKTPTESLIKKYLPPLEVHDKDIYKKIR